MNKSTDEVLGLTAQIVSAHVGHNAVAADALPGLIQEVRPAKRSHAAACYPRILATSFNEPFAFAA